MVLGVFGRQTLQVVQKPICVLMALPTRPRLFQVLNDSPSDRLAEECEDHLGSLPWDGSLPQRIFDVFN